MPRKRVTQLFPFLLPLRTKQRLLFFYTGMLLDKHHYATFQEDTLLPYLLFETSCPLYNHKTGFDMVYQENKVFNLKLVAAHLNKVVIRPNETFSFWKLVRHANRHVPYKEGLTVIDGRLTTAPGGGICQMSNLLFWMFVHSPLTIVERHSHKVKEFPDPPSDAAMGVDATVSEGWLDLKVKNDTSTTFQISITFAEDSVTGRLLTDQDTGQSYEVLNAEPVYYRKRNKVFQEVDVLQKTMLQATGGCISQKPLYRNSCEIAYPLPSGTKVAEKG